jgi:CheY-like chemotaxis protein
MSNEHNATHVLSGTRLDGVKVLVVEDDADSREMLCALLHRFGAQCWTAADVPSAREVLARVDPDVVLSDIGLPGEDGYALLRWVRTRHSPASVPALIAVSAFDDPDAARSAGFVAVVNKPIDIHVLLDAIAEAMKRRSSAP